MIVCVCTLLQCLYVAIPVVLYVDDLYHAYAFSVVLDLTSTIFTNYMLLLYIVICEMDDHYLSMSYLNPTALNFLLSVLNRCVSTTAMRNFNSSS